MAAIRRSLRPGQRGEALDDLEVGVGLEEGTDPLLPLLGLEAADAPHEGATRLDASRRGLEQAGLDLTQLAKAGRTQSPPRAGPRPKDARVRARSIDQHGVEGLPWR